MSRTSVSPGHRVDARVALADPNVLGDLVDASLGVLLDQAGLLYGVQESHAAPVPGGQLAPVAHELDVQVVHIGADRGGQEMLHRLDRYRPVAQRRATRPLRDAVDGGGDADRFGLVRPDEHHARVRGRGVQPDRDLLAGEQAAARQFSRLADGLLPLQD